MKFQNYLEEAVAIDTKVKDMASTLEFLHGVAFNLDEDDLKEFLRGLDKKSRTSFARDIEKAKKALYGIIDDLEKADEA